VKQTPVPEFSPVLPKTICTTLTAVLRSAEIFRLPYRYRRNKSIASQIASQN